ncbi:hypothetical protein [Brevibacillus sp. NRS-1366]|uniref:hypothetical protein n=1 Tax=Brevibacillus sp. NRS-1366 TaxID=3233899 RepID=UPI003D1ED659
MNHLCPVCNGLAALHENCPRCGQQMTDAGRLYDYYGAYSPYREIDDAKMDNGVRDRLHHQCQHTGWCPNCQEERTVVVEEWTSDMLVDHNNATIF